MNPELDRHLRHLRLSGFVQALPVRNQEAINNHLAYVEFLELLVQDELARRRDLLFQRRMKQAQMPPPRSLDEFDWSFNPKIPKQLILDLATLCFIPEYGGALILGPAGLGKSHIWPPNSLALSVVSRPPERERCAHEHVRGGGSRSVRLLPGASLRFPWSSASRSGRVLALDELVPGVPGSLNISRAGEGLVLLHDVAGYINAIIGQRLLVPGTKLTERAGGAVSARPSPRPRPRPSRIPKVPT